MRFFLLFIISNFLYFTSFSQANSKLKKTNITYDKIIPSPKEADISSYYQYGPWSYAEAAERSAYLNNLSDAIYNIYENKSHKYLIATGTVVDKKKIGKWYYYYPNNKVYQIVNYKNGERNDTSKLYNHLGELYSDFNYKKNKLCGKQIYYGNYLCRYMQNSVDNSYYTHTKKQGYEIYSETWMPDESNLSFWTDVGEIKQLQNSDSIIWLNSLGIPILYNYTDREKQNNRLNTKQYRPINKNNIYKINVIKENPNEIRFEFFDGTNGMSYDIYTIEEYISKYNDIQDYKNLIEFHISFYTKDSIQNDNIIQNITGTKSLNHLEKIVIYSSNLSKIPSFVYECNNLKELHISSPFNSWNNEKIESLTNLEILSANSNLISTDNLIKQIYQLPKLNILELGSSNEWYKLKNLHLLQNIKQLSLYPNVNNDNIFTIKLKIPKDVFKLKNLIYFQNRYGGKHFYKSYKIMLKKLPNCYYSPYGTGCLEKGTKISLSNNNDINIEDVKVGDILIAYNEETNSIDTTTVTKTYIHKENVFDCMEIFLQINDSIIKIGTTSNHPFFSQSKGIINAGSIKIDDKLIYIDKSNKIIYPKVQKIQKLKEKYNTVYNIETTKHNYFANGILVHNK